MSACQALHGRKRAQRRLDDKSGKGEERNSKHLSRKRRGFFRGGSSSEKRAGLAPGKKEKKASRIIDRKEMRQIQAWRTTPGQGKASAIIETEIRPKKEGKTA